MAEFRAGGQGWPRPPRKNPSPPAVKNSPNELKTGNYWKRTKNQLHHQLFGCRAVFEKFFSAPLATSKKLLLKRWYLCQCFLIFFLQLLVIFSFVSYIIRHSVHFTASSICFLFRACSFRKQWSQKRVKGFGTGAGRAIDRAPRRRRRSKVTNWWTHKNQFPLMRLVSTSSIQSRIA